MTVNLLSNYTSTNLLYADPNINYLYEDACKVTDDKYAVVYHHAAAFGSGSVWIKIISVDDDKVETVGAEVQIESNECYQARCTYLEDDKILVVYWDQVSLRLEGRVITVSGIVPTVNASTVISTNEVYFFRMLTLDSTNVVIIQHESPSPTVYQYSYSHIGISGTTATGGISTALSYARSIAGLNISVDFLEGSSTDFFVTFHVDSGLYGSRNELWKMRWNGGSSFGFFTTKVINDQDAGEFIVGFPYLNNKVFCFWYNDTNDEMYYNIYDLSSDTVTTQVFENDVLFISSYMEVCGCVYGRATTIFTAVDMSVPFNHFLFHYSELLIGTDASQLDDPNVFKVIHLKKDIVVFLFDDTGVGGGISSQLANVYGGISGTTQTDLDHNFGSVDIGKNADLAITYVNDSIFTVDVEFTMPSGFKVEDEDGNVVTSAERKIAGTAKLLVDQDGNFFVSDSDKPLLIVT